MERKHASKLVVGVVKRRGGKIVLLALWAEFRGYSLRPLS